MRCSNCSAPLLDGTPVCSQCGHVNDAERPAEATPAEPPRPAAKRSDLRAKLGAPKPAAAAPPPDDSTAIGAPQNANAATDIREALPDPEEQPAPRRPASGAVRGVSSGGRAPIRRPGSAPVPAPRSRRAESTEPEGDPDDSETARPQLSARPGNRARPAARRFADPEPDDEGDATDAPPPTSKPRMPAAGPRPMVQPGKYASVAEGRESEGTLARPELAQQQAAAPPPVNPEEVFHAVVAALKAMAFEDKLETFSAMGLLLMIFMPWRSVKGDSDIGLLTWAGFFTLLFASGVLGLIYLRITGRVPTFTSKMLATAELALSAAPLLFTLIFIFTSIDRHTQTYGSLTTYSSMPDFGSVLALLINFALCAGAALVFQRESKQGR